MRSICKGGIYEEFVNSKKFSLPEGEGGAARRAGEAEGRMRLPQEGWDGPPLRRPGGCLLPQGGWSSGDAPPIFFSILWKRKRAVHGPKEKGAKRAPVQWPSARDGGRRIGACSGFAWPSGTLGSSAIFAAAVPWRRVPTASGCKDAFDQLLFPRVPLRYALPGRA